MIHLGATSVPEHTNTWSISMNATYGYLPSGTALPPTTAWAPGAKTRALIPSARRQARSRFIPAGTLATPRTCALGAAQRGRLLQRDLRALGAARLGRRRRARRGGATGVGRDRVGRVGADPLAQKRVAEAAVDAGLAGPRAALAPARVAREAEAAGAVGHEQRAARVALAGVDAALREARADHRGLV